MLSERSVPLLPPEHIIITTHIDFACYGKLVSKKLPIRLLDEDNL
jgi:hypothetical protein